MTTPIPTNIIGGFLGSGKSTVIRHLLKHKPRHERWAVLVNEFGEIGIDKNLLASEQQNIWIKEVTGGCMCCTAGLSMQIALNMLIAQCQPQRILIEPTGLGHPLEIIATLKAEHYADTIDVRATLGLLDAQQIALACEYQQDLFMQQLSAADILLASKSDLYQRVDKQKLQEFLQIQNLDKRPIYYIQQGRIDLQLLAGKSRPITDLPQIKTDLSQFTPKPQDTPESGFIRRENNNDGFYSCGWLFSREYIFNYQALCQFFNKSSWLRLKACFNTEKGMFGFNQSQGQLQRLNIQPQASSKVEVITTGKSNWQELELALQQCIYTRL